MKKNLSKEEKEMKDNLIDESFFYVYTWMANELKLKGNELIVYAVIHGFTKNCEAGFIGSQSYMMKLVGIKSNKTLNRVIKNLIQKGYIVELSHNRSGGNTNIYKAVEKEEILKKLGEGQEEVIKNSAKENLQEKSSEEGLTFSKRGYEKVTDGVCQSYRRGLSKVQTGSVKSTDNNIDYNIDYKIDYNIRKKENKGIKIGERNFEKEEKVYSRESYSQVMDKYNLSKELKKNMFKLIQHCNLNGRIMTNDKLERLITFLLEKPEKERNTLILTAIDKGYFDVFRGTEKSVNESSSARFENERKYTQEYFDSLITNISDIKI